MSIELQKREQRVNELEEIIANKDAMARALKKKSCQCASLALEIRAFL